MLNSVLGCKCIVNLKEDSALHWDEMLQTDCKYQSTFINRERHSLCLLLAVIFKYHLVDLWPFRLRKLKERKKPPFPPVGVLGPSSPRSCANSVPGRSIRRVILLNTSSRKTSGCSWRSFSTKKSGLKMTGWRPPREPDCDSSLLITILHTVPLSGRHRKIVNSFLIVWERTSYTNND